MPDQDLDVITRCIMATKLPFKPKDLLENVSFLQPSVRQNDVILFCRQFSTMIDAGLPIIQCLDILHSQQEKGSGWANPDSRTHFYESEISYNNTIGSHESWPFKRP